MRITILRMIASNSVAGFATNPAALGIGQAGAVRPVRDVQPTGRNASAPKQTAPSTQSPSLLQPGSNLPRGSLLDITA